MRIDKLTTTFQEALGEAQSLALARDNPYIEPVHVLAAMLAQTDGPKALLARAGVNVGRLQAKWIFHLTGARDLEAPPIVYKGVMYVGQYNRVHALDAATGRLIWEHFRQPANVEWQRGIGISLDDFGTGYSSLSYLKVMPLDELKLDRSFVTDIGNSARDQALVASVVQLAQRLELRVVAEGVETETQAAVLAEMGCHVHQGYLYGKPALAAGFSDYLMNSEVSATARTA